MGSNTTETPGLAEMISDMRKQMDSRFDQLESKLERDVSQATQIANDAINLATTNKSDIEQLRTDVNMLQTLCKSLVKENQELKEQTNGLETYSRRNNLIIHGIPEDIGESQESLYKAVRSFFCAKLGINQDVVNNMKFIRCHRLNTSEYRSIKPIIVRFNDYDDRDRVWKLKYKLGVHIDMSICEDYPTTIAYRRRKLLPIFYRARTCGLYDKKNVSLKSDILSIDGTKYTVETLDKLQGDLHPIKICVKEDDNHIAFGGIHSDFYHASNFAKSPFTYNNNQYAHVEQGYAHIKALTFNDNLTASKIMNTTDPAKCKSLASYVKGYNKTVWFKENIDIMTKLVTEKYKQNTALANQLLATDTKILCESVKDKFWGTGISIGNNHALNKKQWSGKNNLGKILCAVRTKLANP